MADPKELLIAAKMEFLHAYLSAFDQFLPLSIENAFNKADNSRSSLDTVVTR